MFETEIRRGATLLDEKRPGWREKVDPDVLDLDSGGLCVLGQAYGQYDIGHHELTGDPDPGLASLVRHGWAEQHGFWRSFSLTYDAQTAKLEDEWKAYLRGEWS